MSNNTNTNDPIRDEEIALKSANLTLYVSPWGASLRGLMEDETLEIITRYKGSHKEGGQGDVLIPFPGRINEGAYAFEGKQYQMVKNDTEYSSAIHGFLRMRTWTVIARTDVSATFAVDLAADDAPGYPFPLHTELTYEVNPSGILVKYAITNTGDTDAPVAAGFHPYYSIGSALIDDTALTVPFKSFLVFDENLITTGGIKPVSETEYDFTHERLIGRLKLNHCFLDPIRDIDGNVAITMRTSDAYKSVSVILGQEFDYVVLYSGDPLPESLRRKSLAIEPMTCGSDGFNRPEWGPAVVKPGEKLTGKFSVVYKTS
jgi:aldose 1-epimerase